VIDLGPFATRGIGEKRSFAAVNRSAFVRPLPVNGVTGESLHREEE